VKACRRRGSSCHRMMMVAMIDEPLNMLDLGHRDSVREALFSFSMEKGFFFRSVLETRFFLSK